MPVSLKPLPSLSPTERSAVMRLSVTPEQVEFAGTIERSVATCESLPAHEVSGLAVLNDDEVVGFLVLKRGTSAPAWVDPSDAVISALRIDLRHQGRGFGTHALQSVSQWLSAAWPETRFVVLSVDEENHAARTAYGKAGFIDLGVREEGRIGWVRYLRKPLV